MLFHGFLLHGLVCDAIMVLHDTYIRNGKATNGHLDNLFSSLRKWSQWKLDMYKSTDQSYIIVVSYVKSETHWENLNICNMINNTPT